MQTPHARSLRCCDTAHWSRLIIHVHHRFYDLGIRRLEADHLRLALGLLGSREERGINYIYPAYYTETLNVC